jgi:hypothetical protein
MMDRKRGFLASVVVLSLVGCSTAANLASPTTTPVHVEASPMPSVTAATPTPTAPLSPTPTTPASNGGAELVVWQMNGKNADDTTESSVFAIDIGTGQRRELATLPENQETCCPSVVAVSSDGKTADLYSPRLRGRVDLAATKFSKRSFRVPPVDIGMSHDGRHVAWVDIVTGSKPTIIVSDADGTNTRRLKLPAGTWFAWLGWSSDDQTILATALVQLKKAVGTIVLIETERGDPGPLAFHLLTVPLDGSPSVDLVDDAEATSSDLKAPASPPPSLNLPNGTGPAREIGQARSSPDGSSVAYVEGTCWTEKKASSFLHAKTACLRRLLTLEVATRATHVVVDDMAGISTLAWSPNGHQIAFRGTDRAGQAGIHVADLGSGTTGFVAPTAGDDNEFLQNIGTVQWSPDGTWIAYSQGSEAHVAPSAWVVRSDGSDAREIAPHAAAGW